MVLNKKVTGKAVAMPTGLALGTGICLLITLAGAAVLAWLVNGESLGENGIGYGAIIILGLSSVCGAWTAAGSIKRRRVQVCMLTGLLYYLVLLAMTALFFGGQYQGMVVTAVVIFIGSGTVSLLGVKGKSVRKMSKLHKAYR